MGKCNSKTAPLDPGRGTRRGRDGLADNLEGRTNTLTDEEFRDKNSLLKEKKIPGTALVTKVVDTLREANGKDHHTNEYDQDDTVLRRGQKFSLEITFDRDVETDHDCVTLQLSYGARPKVSKGTVIRLPLSFKGSEWAKDVGGSWQVQSTVKESSKLRCTIMPPSDASIGNYQLYVETKLKEDEESSRYKHPGKVIIIFNPFCENDTVYMDNKNWREEYVMNDTGKIWVGSKWRNHGKPWNFGQFDKPVLDVAFYLMDLEDLGDQDRNSPVQVSRTISGAVNNCDNPGMLVGNWSGKYSAGTKPTEWTGSVPIAQEFWASRIPVKYGQCWVFSGLVTSLLRAVGIPTRSVTNFQSAHDTDCSMTIDKHFNEDTGEALDHLDDSIWNFHVWNESWFERYDLPDGYGGWQAIDGTPQERSAGLYRCGPASLKAIKEGHVYMNYDARFVFAEVNGDKIQWQVNLKTDTYNVSTIESRAVGGRISTKKVGSNGVEILDNLYKYQEGSGEERRVAEFVNRFSTEAKSNIYKSKPKPEIEFTVDLPDEEMVGEDLSIKVNVKNITEDKRKITGKVTLFSYFYTGVSGKRIKTMAYEETLKMGGEKTLVMSVSLNEYRALMNPEARFSLNVTGKNEDTGRLSAIDRHFELKKPEVTIDIPNGKAKYYEETKANISIKNTTKIELTGCKIHVASVGALESVTFVRGKIQPGEEWRETVSVKPRRRNQNQKMIVAEFDCNQLEGIDGDLMYDVVY